MKILQTPVRFYPFIGGVENYVYYLSQELVKSGHNIEVICANDPPSAKKEVLKGINVKRIPYFGKIANTNITPTLPIEISRSNFDIMHTHLPTPWSADWSMILSKLKNKPLVLSYYNDIIGTGLSDSFARFYNSTSLKLLLKAAEKIIIIQEDYIHFSPYLKDYQEKVVVVPCGVDTRIFQPTSMKSSDKSSDLFFLSVLDDFHRYKGLDYLLEALTVVKQELPHVKLIVGGKGNLINYYQKQVKSLGLENNVEFKGFIPEDSLLEYYNQCRAFVLPSISSAQEGFGIVALEALACAKPVISTEIVGISKDIKKTNSGAIVAPKDSDSLANAILDVLNSEKAHKMGLNGRKLVENKYTWEIVSKMTEAIYKEIL